MKKVFAKSIAVVMASLIGFGSMAVATEANAGFYRAKSKPYSSRPYAKPSSKVSSKPSASTRNSWDAARSRSKVTSTPRATTVAPKSVAPKASTRVPPRSVQSGNTTVIQKNYYNTTNHRGYNSPMYGGGGYGGGMGGGSGLGTSILGGAAGAVGGMMLYDALTTDEGEKALKMQEEQKIVQEAKEEQARDDKLEQIEQNQEKILEGQEKTQEVIPARAPTFYDLDLKNAQ